MLSGVCLLRGGLEGQCWIRAGAWAPAGACSASTDGGQQAEAGELSLGPGGAGLHSAWASVHLTSLTTLGLNFLISTHRAVGLGEVNRPTYVFVSLPHPYLRTGPGAGDPASSTFLQRAGQRMWGSSEMNPSISPRERLSQKSWGLTSEIKQLDGSWASWQRQRVCPGGGGRPRLAPGCPQRSSPPFPFSPASRGSNAGVRLGLGEAAAGAVSTGGQAELAETGRLQRQKPCHALGLFLLSESRPSASVPSAAMETGSPWDTLFPPPSGGAVGWRGVGGVGRVAAPGPAPGAPEPHDESSASLAPAPALANHKASAVPALFPLGRVVWEPRPR